MNVIGNDHRVLGDRALAITREDQATWFSFFTRAAALVEETKPWIDYDATKATSQYGSGVLLSR